LFGNLESLAKKVCLNLFLADVGGVISVPPNKLHWRDMWLASDKSSEHLQKAATAEWTSFILLTDKVRKISGESAENSINAIFKDRSHPTISCA
jgi:hypothetical protein